MTHEILNVFSMERGLTVSYNFIHTSTLVGEFLAYQNRTEGLDWHGCRCESVFFP